MMPSHQSASSSAPLLVTLRFDAATFERLNALRTRHFPAERNYIPAHLTLFHALPGECEALVCENVSALCARNEVLSLRCGPLRVLGRGVAVDVICPDLIRLRNDLKKPFQDVLTPQDAQNWKHPHVTLQNKVTPEQARRTFETLSANWQEWDGQGEGLMVWYYRGGPWEKLGDFRFASPNTT